MGVASGAKDNPTPEMPRVIDSPDQFAIIGENIHATRVVLRNGRRAVTLEDGAEAVPFKDQTGEQRHLTVPDWFKKTQPYEQGQIKHFLIAVMDGIGDDPEAQEEGAAYVEYEVRRQARAGAQYLDLNVDEVSYNLDVQKKAMKWLVETVQRISPLPPSVDSSNSEIIGEGLAAYDRRAGRPMINSLALERLDTLDMVLEHDAKVIVTAAGESGMPQDDQERVQNVTTLIDKARSRGVEAGDIYVDALVFPISVDPSYGNHYLDAVRALREAFGTKIHITGGLSNVSFGLPHRKLINETFIYLGLEAGIDSGIMDPIQTKLRRVFDQNTNSELVKFATDMLEGRDEYCVSYLQAYRAGKLK